ncbi:signal peptidase I [Marinilactibacillus piezotolerans]|uniref:Signal peptidase I n=1 Tax=Marinilactibacillus piezotolerans TaxID=258723 RepID=A0A1I3UQB5_9LACT|nr:signal peptidase I [Marinilactibacillus piezotolerans]SFJ84051.1 signal peptidase I [Marinilactibacillus piezotolerans]
MSDQQYEESGFEPRKSKYGKNNKKKPEKKRTFLQELVSTVLYIVILTGVFYLVQMFLYAPVSVEGESMAPTLEDGDKLLLNKFSDYERFDIIVFPAPDDPEKQYIKRIIGLPGDEIRYSDETLYINDEEVDEPYLDGIEIDSSDSKDVIGGTINEFSLESLQGVETVPENQYFVMGDNRGNSRDSRYFGFVSGDTITGKTTYRFFPFNHFGSIDEQQ